MTPSQQSEPRLLHLSVVRGETRGTDHRLMVRGSATVGRRSTCDLVLAKEPSLEPEQLRLVHSGHLIFLEDLSANHTTLVNGLSPLDPQPVQTGDLIGTRNVILRVRVEG
jgi:hypothetical protein